MILCTLFQECARLIYKISMALGQDESLIVNGVSFTHCLVNQDTISSIVLPR